MPRSNKDISILERTRLKVLSTSLMISGWLMDAGYSKQLHRLPEPFDLGAHSSHFLPGVVIGYAANASLDRAGLASRTARIGSIATTALVGGLFETGWVDGMWYRNTTHDPVDALWTTVAGVLGAFCLRTYRRESKQPNS